MKTNNITHTITETHGKYDIIISIRLNDECKNGHEDFAITGDIYNAGKRGDRNRISGGCIHEEIIKYRPDLKPFIELHLAQFDGIPMHASANMHYHLREGFSNKSIDFCEYYRITPEVYEAIKDASSAGHLAIILKDMGVPEQWKQQAGKAIKMLEEMTGKQFESTATRPRVLISEEDEKQERRHTHKGKDMTG